MKTKFFTMGEKLRDLRNVTGLSQRAFGEKIGVARGSLNGYENSPNPIPRGVIWKICQATDIGVEYFETDMDLAQAFAKYKLNPHRLEVKDMQECICSLYDGIENFIEQITCKDPLNTNGDKIIIEYNKNIYAVQYFKMQEIMLFEAFNEGGGEFVLKFSNDEDFAKSVKILALIIAKMNIGIEK